MLVPLAPEKKHPAARTARSRHQAIFPVVEVALTRLDAHGVWANASEVLVQSSPLAQDGRKRTSLSRSSSKGSEVVVVGDHIGID